MDQQTNDLISKEIESNEVCLFMKGTPDAPQCGFSMAVSNILKILDVIPGLGLQEIEETELGGLDVNIHGERGYIADGAD
mgnify:CR=1 FL=1